MAQFLAGTFFAVLVLEAVVRIVHPFDRLEFIVDDELLWRYRPGQNGINASGFRGRDLAPDDRRPRLLFLGDSFAFGVGVGEAETYSALIQDVANDCVLSVNAGMPGWGVFQYETLLRLSRYAFHAQVVIVDLGTAATVQRQPFTTESERQKYLRLHRLTNAISEYSRLAVFIGRLLERLSMMLTSRSTPTEVGGASLEPELFSRQLEANIQRLGAMHEMVARQGGVMAVVLWPAGGFPYNEAFIQDVTSWGGRTGVPVVDLTTSLTGLAERQWRIQGDVHPNELGHRIAAHEVFRTIAELAPVLIQNCERPINP